MSIGLRRAATTALTRSGLAHLCRPLTRGAILIYMLHRFEDADRGVGGCDPRTLRSFLAFLRRRRYQLVDLQTVLSSLESDGPPLHAAVAFTVDDGYEDLATIGGPLFAEFDCPVTAFVATGFLDGHLWLWWDQIEYILTHTARRNVTFEWEDGPASYQLSDVRTRGAAQADFIARCKALPDHRLRAAVQDLALFAHVSLPGRAPPAYTPMTWDQVRAWERRGMTFAPHTVTHPILARTENGHARTEIVESWARLRAEATRPAPIFAYPNGKQGDFGLRDFQTLREAGVRAALTSVEGFATVRRYRAPHGPFRIPRFPLPDSLPYLIQQVSGLERLKFLLRGMD